jgi:y4mF family transcriptional regulator
MTSEEIGKIVLLLRKKSGLTQKQLADLAGVGKSVVFDIEKGKETIQLNTLLKIFSALNIDIKLFNPILHSLDDSNEES